MITNIDLNTTYSGAEAPEVITQKSGRRTYKYVPYAVEQNEEGIYTWKYVIVSPKNYDYSGLIDAIIGVKYSLRTMLAIMNNYMASPKNPAYKQEFLDMQAWRTTAKDYAKKHFNI